MTLIPVFKVAIGAMRANIVRTGLTVLGMVIGIAAVIIVFSAGEGINGLITGQIESFGGSDMIETELKVPSTKQGNKSEMQSGMNLAMGVQVTSLTLDDMEDINKLPNIKTSYAGIMGQEDAFTDALRSAAAYRVTDGRLEIVDAGGKTVLVFARQQ